MSTTTGPRASLPGRENGVKGSAGTGHGRAPLAGGRAPAAAPVAATGPGRPLRSPFGGGRPRADCTADSAGGLTFDVRLPGEVPEEGNAALLLRRRGGVQPPQGTPPATGVTEGLTAAVDTVRLPLARVGPDGPLRAALPSIMTLPEGRWDVYLSLGEREPQRLLPGVHDLRSLVGRTPRSGRTWFGVRIPYATRYGNLTVRAWLRWPHAEAGELRVVDGGMVLRGRLYGALLTGTARLEAHARVSAETVAAGTERPAAVVATAGGGPSGDDGRDGSAGTAFVAELPYAALADAALWDLWLRPETDAEPVRIARILDDVPDKKRIFTYPAQRLAGASAVRPYYTLDNDLSVRVDRVEGPEAGGTE